MPKTKHILFGVLNWGLGHATRSISIINALCKNGFTVTIASDGLALALLKKEFPNCQFLTLENPNVEYASKGSQILSVGKQSLALSAWHLQEKKTIAHFLHHNPVCGIISDNRPSVYSPNIPSVYMTHQLFIKAKLLSTLASFGHTQLIKNYTQIWVPDVYGDTNLSGDLGHKKHFNKIKYIGLLSDLVPFNDNVGSTVSVVLSGPEPQRTLLENKLIEQLKGSKQQIRLLRGTKNPLSEQLPTNWNVIDLATRNEVKDAYQSSKFIIARCGYSTLMDLYCSPKAALLIPTPGQPEQEYLASMPYHNQHFAIQNQSELDVATGLIQAEANYKNLSPIASHKNWEELFCLFSKTAIPT